MVLRNSSSLNHTCMKGNQTRAAFEQGSVPRDIKESSRRGEERRKNTLHNVKYLTGDDKSSGNSCGKNIIKNLIEIKQNLHNTAN